MTVKTESIKGKIDNLDFIKVIFLNSAKVKLSRYENKKQGVIGRIPVLQICLFSHPQIHC